MPKLTCLADLTPQNFASVCNILPEIIRKRAYHVVTECERVRLAVKAMQEGNMFQFGRLLNESHTASSVPLYLYNAQAGKTLTDNTEVFQLAKSAVLD